MRTYGELFAAAGPFILNPPYEGKQIREIRGISLPADYFDFMQSHNGGTFSVSHNETARLVLFPLEDIRSGDCYRDEDGYWLGACRSRTHAYQNIDTQTVTTPNGIACEDSAALHQAFFDDHIVIGFCEEESNDAVPYVSLLAIDRAGNYRVICDGDAECMGRHEFGTYVKTAYGGYVKYNVCLYESPLGLLDPDRSSDGKGYRIVDRSEIEIRKKKYAYYRSYGVNEEPHWAYDFAYTDHDDRYGWKGTSMRDLFAFFLSEER